MLEGHEIKGEYEETNVHYNVRTNMVFVYLELPLVSLVHD